MFKYLRKDATENKFKFVENIFPAHKLNSFPSKSQLGQPFVSKQTVCVWLHFAVSVIQLLSDWSAQPCSQQMLQILPTSIWVLYTNVRLSRQSPPTAAAPLPKESGWERGVEVGEDSGTVPAARSNLLHNPPWAEADDAKADDDWGG